MKTIARCLIVLCAVSTTSFVLPPDATAQCPGGAAICATVHASEATDPEYEGYWEYCAEVEWNTTGFGGHGLSHTDVLLGLENCATACDEGVFAFADPAGEGEGEGGCTVYFFAIFECEGDPLLLPQFPFPTIKFEPYEDECEPGPVGTALLCFYSDYGPAPWEEYTNHVAVKFGTSIEMGPLVGQLPECPSTPVEQSTWTLIKGIYR